MKRLQAYKFELMPDGEQTRAMRQYAGCCRVFYNKALAWQNAQLSYNPPNVSGYNAIDVTQTASVPLYFGKLLGKSSVNIAATA